MRRWRDGLAMMVTVTGTRVLGGGVARGRGSIDARGVTRGDVYVVRLRLRRGRVGLWLVM